MLWGLGCSGWNHWASASMASFDVRLFHSIVISRFQKTKLQGLLRFSLRPCTRSLLPHSVCLMRPAPHSSGGWGALPLLERSSRELVLCYTYGVLPAKLNKNFSTMYFLQLLTPLCCLSCGVYLDSIFDFLNYLLSTVSCVLILYHICYLVAELPLKIVEATLFESWFVLKCLYFAFFLNHNFWSLP